MTAWPRTETALVEAQRALGRARPEPWSRPDRALLVGACFACFADHPDRPGGGWAAAVVTRGRRVLEAATGSGPVAAPYLPALLALRAGPLLEGAVRALAAPPDVLLVDATGRDHPRRAGLALHLGAVLGIPTVGVTNRPLRAEGAWPADAFGAVAPLRLDGEVVGNWLRTRPGTRPVAVHAAWRTSPDDAVEVVLAATRGVRTPHPLRRARQRARRARALAQALAQALGDGAAAPSPPSP